MRTTQLAIPVVDLQAVLVEDFARQLVLRARLEPALVRIMHKRRIGDVLPPELIVIEEVAVEPLDKLAQRRCQRAFLGRAFAIGKTHRRVRIADVQRPHIGDDVAPGGDFNLHAQVGQDARHVGDGLLQRQVLARNVGARLGGRVRHQQRLGIGVEVFDLFNHELRPGLHHLLYRTTVDGAQDPLTVLGGNVRWQFNLNLENLVVAVFRINNVVLRQADIFGGDIASFAIQLHEVRRTQRRRSQEVIERPRCRAIALVANGLIGNHREVVELGFKSKVVEKVDLDFHVRLPE
ncbi:hypothetical protein D9M73_126400 [compost metagenome]